MDAAHLTDIEFEAVFSVEQLKEAESNNRLIFGRRVTLLALTKDKEALANTVRNLGAAPFGAWLAHVEDFQAELKFLLELSESARARLIVAGQVAANRPPN